MKKSTIAFQTLGCKLNFSETSEICRTILKTDQYELVDFSQRADLYVISTCSVTENANRKCRKIIRGALRRSPNAHVAVTGCYAQLKPEEISKIPGVDLVLGTGEKFNLNNYLESIGRNGGTSVYSCDISEVESFVSSYSFGERTRSYLKVQDGCNYNCSFCTIPLARGVSRCDTTENVVLKANEIANNGIKEIVLTGVNIGDFVAGRDDNFLNLLYQLNKVDGIDRIRISSIEPNLLSDEIIQFASHSKTIMPHFHIPLQSGSNKILKKMKRRYLKELYENRVRTIKKLIPDCCIGVDVIVGFPGETEKDFLETYNFIHDLDISYLHVFSYSERENTEAIHYHDVVHMEERQNRCKILRKLSESKRKVFYENQLSTTHSVLFESYENGELSGFTENYMKVNVEGDQKMIGTITPINLNCMRNNVVIGNFVH
tara:strand:- start:3344 stop:4639 length:1296 start_codon:yes stop_codon:yes gene_type:complete